MVSLFPHLRQDHGQIENFLFTVDVVEALTGEDFFSDPDNDDEARLEDTDLGGLAEGWALRAGLGIKLPALLPRLVFLYSDEMITLFKS